MLDLENSSTISEASHDALRQLLNRYHLPHSVDQVVDILAGVAAAPPNPAWLSLIAADPDPELKRALEDLLQRIAAMQSPAEPETPAVSATRVAALRARLAALGVDGLLVPRGDEHQGEYVPERARRLAWLTGFTGSAGFAIVLPERACFFTDGRYTLQARSELDAALFELADPATTPQDWLADALKSGQVLGYDPWLLSAAERDRYADVAARAGATLAALAENPIDHLWGERQPAPPLAPAYPHPLALSGRSADDKRTALAATLGADACVLTQPDSLAWLLNIRGGDLPHTPTTLAFAILAQDASVRLFIDRRKLVAGTDEHLGAAVEVCDPDGFGPALDGLSGRRVRLDPAAASAWIVDRLKAAGAVLVAGHDPCVLPKACKNPVELEGARRAHRRDAVAVTRFLRWLDEAVAAGTLDEIAAADRLEAFRRESPLLRDLSFTTISGAGPNGAIVHYRVTPQTCRTLESGSFYLVDSGAQYPDGTTDITRTVPIGTPTPEMKDRFTRVLKGHIALATACFPRGTSGVQLDVLARLPLWQAGLDYEHGTGHGIGSFLSVHEGPQRISKHPLNQPLLPGMIVSNEPGYYKEGAYGIRTENLMVVRPCAELDRQAVGAERDMLCFETLTHVPIDHRAIDWDLVSPPERAWLAAYEAECARIFREETAGAADG